MPALILANKSQSVLFYDLTSSPPVLRNETPATVQLRDGSSWKHSSVMGAYSDDELTAVLAYLRSVAK